MFILGIVEGHNCSAALLNNGQVVAVCFEERLSRLKNDFGYPKKSIEYCLSVAGITGADLDCVALVSKNLPLTQLAVKREATFSVEDYQREQEEFWKPVLLEGKKTDYLEVFSDKLYLEELNYDFTEEELNSPSDIDLLKVRYRTLSNHLGVESDRVKMVHHHLAHSLYAVYSTPDYREKQNKGMLVLASDGYGDDCSASVGVFKNGSFEFLSKSPKSGLGRIYRYATLLLNMRPGVDEYKVMGLAPYSKEYHWSKAYKEFLPYLKVNGLEIDFTNPDKDIYFSLKQRLKSSRFDGLAGGLQHYTEEISKQWVKSCVEKTGLKDIVYSGGVSMNIKVNQSLLALDEVESLFVGPSGGDESLSIGAAWAACAEDFPEVEIQPLANTYLGPEYEKSEVCGFIDTYLPNGFHVYEDPTIDTVSEVLASGRVVARACGRMEYGARSLGNRSILADARSLETKQKINDKIKRRDFWMPFAPVILNERVSDYVQNPKEIFSPYMTIGFDSTAKARQELIAGLHPADYTMRPQMLTKQMNPELHALISAYESKTGVGGLVNTSFNLHGEPICESPKDSIKTFLNSELDVLLMDGYLVSREAL